MKKAEKAILILLGLAFVVCGCQEAQQTQRVWGQGDPPADWQDFFGNDNISRLDFVHSQLLQRHADELVQLTDRIKELEEPMDPNEIEWLEGHRPDVKTGLRADGVFVWGKKGLAK